jgi:hypothetical protein
VNILGTPKFKTIVKSTLKLSPNINWEPTLEVLINVKLVGPTIQSLVNKI